MKTRRAVASQVGLLPRKQNREKWQKGFDFTAQEEYQLIQIHSGMTQQCPSNKIPNHPKKRKRNQIRTLIPCWQRPKCGRTARWHRRQVPQPRPLLPAGLRLHLLASTVTENLLCLNRAGTVLSEEHDCYGNWSEHTQLHGSYSALTQEPHQNTQFSALQLPTWI